MFSNVDFSLPCEPCAVLTGDIHLNFFLAFAQPRLEGAVGGIVPLDLDEELTTLTPPILNLEPALTDLVSCTQEVLR